VGETRGAKQRARLGEVFAGFGYRPEALAAFADALALDKDDITLRLKYADLLGQDGQHDAALAQLDVAAKQAGNADEAEAVLLAQIKGYQATETLLTRAEALQKELEAGTAAPAERWHRLASYYEANRQPEEATAAILKALALDPKSVPILTAAARIHEQGGNLTAAADAYRRLAA